MTTKLTREQVCTRRALICAMRQEGLSLRRVGVMVGVTPERIRQIEVKANERVANAGKALRKVLDKKAPSPALRTPEMDTAIELVARSALLRVNGVKPSALIPVLEALSLLDFVQEDRV